MTNPVKESDIQRDIKTYLQYKGWFVVKIHQSMGSYKGIADLSCTKDGRHVWVEVKAPRGKQSLEQAKFGCAVLAHGGEYIVAKSVDDVERYLAETKLSKPDKS